MIKGFFLVLLLVVVVPVFLLAVFVIGAYNRLVTLRNRFKNAYAQIEVQLKRRYDLIPNLVETVKGYLAHERNTLEAVISARNVAAAANQRAAANPGDPSSMKALISAESGLAGALGRLFAVAEAYPDLKANQNFLQLQADLSDIENKIAAARRFFNNSVQEFNTGIEQFPAALFARSMGFAHREFFDVGEEERKTIAAAPQVKF